MIDLVIFVPEKYADAVIFTPVEVHHLTVTNCGTALAAGVWRRDMEVVVEIRAE